MQEKTFTGYGATLRKYRNQAGLSQLELAEVISTTRGTIVNWELERSQPDMLYLQRLCKTLKIPTAEILQVDPQSVSHEYSKDEKTVVSLYCNLSASSKELAKKLLLTIKETEQSGREK